MSDWNIEKARNLYNINHWGKPYFDINEKGNLIVRPRQKLSTAIDLEQVALEIQNKGISWPVLLRITDILQDRVSELCNAFIKSQKALGYKGNYTAVYPIKVNQQRTVVEHLIHQKDHSFGLEAGSKPELMIVLTYSHTDGGKIICNGYKDREYIRLALIGQRLGHQVYIVIEKQSELKLILEESAKMNIRPLLGIRVRLSSIGKGNWQNTGGEKSKFGLSANQVLNVTGQLEENNMLDCLKLVHCHLGSQLANIHDIQTGLREVARYYSELHKLNVPIDTVDVGGGLGVDYEGTRSRSYFSMNYSIQEYANDVVHALWQTCKDDDLPHPDIISESGRAMTAHHAILISNIIDTETTDKDESITKPDASFHRVTNNLWETLQSTQHHSALESYHDAVHWLNESQNAYSLGLIDLKERAVCEKIYVQICRLVQPRLNPASRSHREVLDELSEKLVDKYFINLSIFQSLPDIWAINQIFPIVPIHRLDEEPARRVRIQDLTCDSDGAIDHYVDTDSIEPTLAAHEVRPGEDYLLGIFLVGAYQETLGDMHNLFGDTHSINLELKTDGGYKLTDHEDGDSIDEILDYVHYNIDQMTNMLNDKINQCDLKQNLRAEFMNELKNGLSGYSYLED